MFKEEGQDPVMGEEGQQGVGNAPFTLLKEQCASEQHPSHNHFEEICDPGPMPCQIHVSL